MVSKARLDFPEPLKPRITVKELRGISTGMFLRLCWRAPRTVIFSIAIPGSLSGAKVKLPQSRIARRSGRGQTRLPVVGQFESLQRIGGRHKKRHPSLEC